MADDGRTERDFVIFFTLLFRREINCLSLVRAIVQVGGNFAGTPGGGNVYSKRVMVAPVSATPAPANLILAKYRSPWSIILRMGAISIVAAFISQTIVLIPFGIVMGDPFLSMGGIICAFPFVTLFIFMMRPKLVEVVMVTPNQNGATMHALSDGRTLKTPLPTTMKRHIVRDSGAFDIPNPKNLWSVFFVTLGVSVTLIISTLAAETSGSTALTSLNMLAIVFLAIPLMLLGFSIPVFAWWSYSSKKLGLPTRGHEAEAALTAGMLSTIPAICINGIAFPIFLATIGIVNDWTTVGIAESYNLPMFLTLAVSAPVGEEVCKLGAVLLMARYIDSPRRGFQVGFTVGLGFAIVENLIYVAGGFFGGGLIGFTFTSLIRGIGSIPGHAVWTGISGLTVGWLLSSNKSLAESVRGVLGEDADSDSMEQPTWSLIDKDSGQQVDSVGSGLSLGQTTISHFDYDVQVSPNQSRIPLPKTVLGGLLLAILGHSFWNGSLFLLGFIAELIGLDEIGQVLVALGWMAFLVTGILYLGIKILHTVATLPGPFSIH